ncbi:MAG: O-antigen ligase domain-containing protein, partial [Acidobacteria bacterium]
MIRHLNLPATLAAAILLLLLIAAPLPFASVLPFERALIQVGACVALGLAIFDRESGAALRRVRVPVLALAALGLLGLLQSLSWPRPLAGALAPAAIEAYDRAQAIVGEPVGAAVPLSLAPPVSRATGIHLLALAAAFAAAAVAGNDRSLRRLLAAGILATAIFEIVYGADRWFKGDNAIWGLEVEGEIGRLRGTFVNPDHLALYLSLVLAMIFAWLWWAVRRQRYESALEKRLLLLAPPLLAFVMTFVALSFTGSRAGLTAGVAALGVQTAILVARRGGRRWLLLGGAGLVTGFAAIAFFGLRAGLGRFVETSAFDLAWNARLLVYRHSLELWWRFPWTGTGLGTFRQAFPLVQGEDLPGTWTHAHSDLLELLVTAGVVALPLAAAGIWALVRRLREVERRGRRSEDRAAGLAALGALTATAIASALDFGLTMPANAFTLAVICGLAA